MPREQAWGAREGSKAQRMEFGVASGAAVPCPVSPPSPWGFKGGPRLATARSHASPSSVRCYTLQTHPFRWSSRQNPSRVWLQNMDSGVLELVRAGLPHIPLDKGVVQANTGSVLLDSLPLLTMAPMAKASEIAGGGAGWAAQGCEGLQCRVALPDLAEHDLQHHPATLRLASRPLGAPCGPCGRSASAQLGTVRACPDLCGSRQQMK